MTGISQDDKLKAAYALNLCTVSVSQIVDYNDINVLEQEYEAILNNLNLEHMPHDEALLYILKQLLDTITFFRIQEGDKKMMDMKYRQKMKDAIWGAVPNFGVFVAGVDPLTIAISLASQVGIGYMNYRKNKASNQLEYQEQQWQLQRTAIEQFNGLRRELFDTAWRLADTYGFSDEMRLTERQIKHYDEILMDNNVLRKYDRLESIKDNFVAYPPFWYHMGNSANEIARSDKLQISDETRAIYRENAKKHFAQYWESNKYPLLREDQIASACALEYADLLLEDGEDINYAVELVDNAVKYSGDAWDVLQLCAIGYMRAGFQEKAVPALRILVNEKYNTSVNAQLLSGIYIGQYTKDGNEEAKSQYEILSQRVSNPKNLIPWPKEGVDSKTEFNSNQRNMLTRRFHKLIKEIRNEYTIKFNKLLPGPDPYIEYEDSFFSENKKDNRIEKIERAFNIAGEKDRYISELAGNAFSFKYIDTYNELIHDLDSLKSIDNMDSIIEIGTNNIKDNAEILSDIQRRMQTGEFSFDDYMRCQDILSDKTRDRLFDEAWEQIAISINEMSQVNEFSAATSRISDYCTTHGVAWPDLNPEISSGNDTLSDSMYIGYETLGKDAAFTSRKYAKAESIRNIIDTSVREAILNNNKLTLLMKGESEFDKYFKRAESRISRDYKTDTLAVLDDHGAFVDIDILFTVSGFICIMKNSVVAMNSYDKSEYNKEEESLELDGLTYKNKNADIMKLSQAIAEINHILKR